MKKFTYKLTLINLKPFSILLILFLCFISLSSSSCCKDEPQPDLVPITTTGENTMGFYVEGVPYNIRGISTWSNPKGVKGGVTQYGVLGILGGINYPKITLTIDILLDTIHPEKEYIINGSDFSTNWVDLIDDAVLGGNIYNCNSQHNGFITLLKLEDNFASGTFYFDVINPETGKVIKVTDGRFDIKFF